jgi:hypothetical protein
MVRIKRVEEMVKAQLLKTKAKLIVNLFVLKETKPRDNSCYVYEIRCRLEKIKRITNIEYVSTYMFHRAFNRFA